MSELSWEDRCVDVTVLVGKTMASVKDQNDELVFTTVEGEVYRLYHSQDCCESVTIDDISGDLSDLVGSPLTMSEEIEGEIPEAEPGSYPAESETWTFYKFATLKGYVTVRWYGTSNGYYSESVYFERVR